MEEEEDEDIYAPTDIDNGSSARIGGTDTPAVAHTTGVDLEEGEEEGEEVEEDDTDSVSLSKPPSSRFLKIC